MSNYNFSRVLEMAEKHDSNKILILAKSLVSQVQQMIQK